MLIASYTFLNDHKYLLSETTSEKVPPKLKFMDCVSWSLSMRTELRIW